jgi:hypothetical protein
LRPRFAAAPAFRPVNTGISAAGPGTVEHLPVNFQIVGGNFA